MIGVELHQHVQRIADAVEVSSGAAGLERGTYGNSRLVEATRQQVNESVNPACAAQPDAIVKRLEQLDRAQ